MFHWFPWLYVKNLVLLVIPFVGAKYTSNVWVNKCGTRFKLESSRSMSLEV